MSHTVVAGVFWDVQAVGRVEVEEGQGVGVHVSRVLRASLRRWLPPPRTDSTDTLRATHL